MYLREMPGLAGGSRWQGSLGKGVGPFSRHTCKALIVRNGSDKPSTVVLDCSCPVCCDLSYRPEQNYRVPFTLEDASLKIG